MHPAPIKVFLIGMAFVVLAIGGLVVHQCFRNANKKDGMEYRTLHTVFRTEQGTLVLQNMNGGRQFLPPDWCLFGDKWEVGSQHNYTKDATHVFLDKGTDKCVWLKPAVKEECREPTPCPLLGFGTVL